MELSIIAAISGPAVIALLSLLAANLILSVVAATVKGTFTFRKLADFIPKRVVPLIGYVVIASLANIVEGWTAVVVTTYAGLVALYSTGILAALKSLGLKLPDVLTEKEKK